MSDIVVPAVISNTVVATLCIGLFRLHWVYNTILTFAVCD